MKLAALWVSLHDRSESSGSGASSVSSVPSAPSFPARRPESTKEAGAPAAVYDDVVTVDRYTGFDLDSGRAAKVYKQDADTDLYLGDYFALSTSTRHRSVHMDSYAGDESGAYQRCRTYRLAGKAALPFAMATSMAQQYCFTSSAGRPGWMQVTMQGPSSVVAKVVIWSSAGE